MRPQRPCRQPHGTIARYTAGCSCFECCESWREYQHAAREGRRYIGCGANPREVRRRVHRLLRVLPIGEIARRAGVSRTTVRALRDGKNTKFVRREVADAIKGVAA